MLQNEKRQLETALVVESRMHHKGMHDSQRRLMDGGEGWQASEVLISPHRARNPGTCGCMHAS